MTDEEIDLAVATKIVGLVEGEDYGVFPEHEFFEWGSQDICIRCRAKVGPGVACTVSLPSYSREEYLAFAVTANLTGRSWKQGEGFGLELRRDPWTAKISSGDLSVQWADSTAARALCIAALSLHVMNLTEE